MGTRSLTGVRYQGVDKLSYNQFDGYPSGVGQQVVDELRRTFAVLGGEAAIADLRAKALALRLVDECATPSAEDFAQHGDAHDGNVSTGTDWYALLRGDQGSLIKRLDRGVATDGSDFIRDSLFCEYAYILNLDNDPCLEIYKGFQKAPHDLGRYGRIPLDPDEEKQQIGIHGHAWFPCALVATFPLTLESLPLVLEEALPPDPEEADLAA